MYDAPSNRRLCAVLALFALAVAMLGCGWAPGKRAPLAAATVEPAARVAQPGDTPNEARSLPAGVPPSADAAFTPASIDDDPRIRPAVFVEPLHFSDKTASLDPAPLNSPPLDSPPLHSAPLDLAPLESGPLDLARLEAMALAHNPAVLQAEAQLAAFDGKHLQAGLPPNWTLGYLASEIGNERRAGQQGIYVGRELVTGHKRYWDQQVVAHEQQRADQQLAAVRQRVRSDVQQGYYEVLIAQHRLDVARRLAATGERIENTLDAQVRAQEASRIDFLQARAEVNQARLLFETAEATHAAAWRRLAAVVGIANLPPERLAGDQDDLGPPLRFEDTLGRIQSTSPELAAAWAQVERAAAALERARAEAVPNVQFQASVQHDNITSDTIAGVQVGLPLPIRNRNQGAIRQAQAEWLAAQHAAERVSLALHRRLATVFRQYQVGRQQSLRYRDDILPDVEETMQLTTQAYEAGEVGFLQLLTAERSYFQAHLAMLDALGTMWQAQRQIEGLLLDGSLEAE